MDRGLFGTELAGMALNFGLPMNSDRWDRRVDYLYERLKDVDDSTFKKACDKIGMRSIRFPTLADFLEAVQGSVPIGWKPKSFNKEPCEYCNDTGFLTAVKELAWRESITTVDYSFRCICVMGKLLSEEIPFWDKKWKGRGYSLKKWDLSGMKSEASMDLEEIIKKLVEKAGIRPEVKEEAPF